MPQLWEETKWQFRSQPQLAESPGRPTIPVLHELCEEEQVPRPTTTTGPSVIRTARVRDRLPFPTMSPS